MQFIWTLSIQLFSTSDRQVLNGGEYHCGLLRCFSGAFVFHVCDFFHFFFTMRQTVLVTLIYPFIYIL